MVTSGYVTEKMAVTSFDQPYLITPYMLHANFMALCFIKQKLLPINILPFCSCDPDLDPMTFIYELNSYSLRPSSIPDVRRWTFKVKEFESIVYVHSYRQTRPKLHTTPDTVISCSLCKTPLNDWSQLARDVMITSRRHYANSTCYQSDSVSTSKWHVWFASRCPGMQAPVYLADDTTGPGVAYPLYPPLSTALQQGSANW